jgi:crotonobetainyl-CoA:carnitine CoA-transferase CaiB-like acyl-CoA transferase
MEGEIQSCLGSFRVLDLTFFHDIPDSEKSLYWFAHNTSKRGITLNINSADGQELFRKLVRSADVVLECFLPGHLNQLGLGYSELTKVAPSIVMTSITAFGQSGPYRDYKASNLVAQAMGGMANLCGFPDGPPVCFAGDQAYYQVSLQAATATMLALYYREVTGEGQNIEVSMQQAVAASLLTATPPLRWIESGVDLRRQGNRLHLFLIDHRHIFQCRDGFINWRIFLGQLGYEMARLIEWMENEGMADDEIKKVGDWSKIGVSDVTQQEVERWEETFARFFLTHTKAELFQAAQERDLMIHPVNTIGDVMTNPQLLARDFYEGLKHPELGTTITYPGALFKATETPYRLRGRAPLIGEHNLDIYVEEMGLSIDDMVTLKEGNII